LRVFSKRVFDCGLRQRGRSTISLMDLRNFHCRRPEHSDNCIDSGEPN
jgi:hypothetical protein